MKVKANGLQKLLANVIAAPFPTRQLRCKVRHIVRREHVYSMRRYELMKKHWRNLHKGPIIPARYREYDLVFSIGVTCPTTIMLAMFQLRKFTSPLDWTEAQSPINFKDKPNIMRDSRFNEKIMSICTEFENYFNFEDMRLLCSHPLGEKHQLLLNTRTHIGFPHVFPITDSWERHFPTAREKIIRRGKRLIDAINNSDRILLVWAHRMHYHKNFLDAPVADEDIKHAINMLNKKWPGKHFDIVLFEHDGTKQKFEFDKITVCDGAYRVRSNHFDECREYRDICPKTKDAFDPPVVVAEMLDNISVSG